MPLSLTAQQRAVVDAEEDGILVRACPGAGKTLTSAHRVAALCRSTGPGCQVVGLSFTNAGATELATAVSRNHASLLGSGRLLVATIDAFFDRFIVRPFAHQAFGLHAPLQVVSEPSVVHRARRAFKAGPTNSPVWAWDIEASYDRGGNVALAHRGRPVTDRTVKMALVKWFQAGFYSHRHRAFLAAVCLHKFPLLGNALASRLSHILVDEFQDTSSTQQFVLNRLHCEFGVPVTLVGDPNQSIYGFRGACPDGFDNPRLDWGCTEYRLGQSFRCSDPIANLLTGLAPNSRVIGRPSSSAGTRPLGFVHANDDFQSAIERFKEALEQEGIPMADAAVLVRGHQQLSGIVYSQAGKLTGLAQMLAKAAEHRDTEGSRFDAVRALKRALQHVGVEPALMVPRALGTPEHADNAKHLRTAMNRFLLDSDGGLPLAGLAAEDWLAKTRVNFAALCASLGLDVNGLNLGRRITRRGVRELDAPIAEGSIGVWRTHTIHYSKGLTFRAVLVLGSPQFMTKALGQARDGTLSDEEARLLYVALSRAHTFLAWGLPASTYRRHRDLVAALPIDVDIA